jgi:hypothetical protein
MNRKFYFGLFMVFAGSSALGAIAAYSFMEFLNTRKKNEEPVTMKSNEFLAHVHALKITMQKAAAGEYDNVPNADTEIRNDFAFYKIAFLEQ